jgi:aquaporin Z
MFGRQKVAALAAEFLGTGFLTLLMLSVQRSTIGVPFFVAIAAGLTLILMMFSLARVSGGHFNPALTIALWTARKVQTLTGALYIAAQLLGAWAAYGLYTYLVNNTLQPIGGHFTGRILVAEAVGAGILGFGYAAAAYQRFNAAVTATVTGLSYTLAIVAASAAAIGLVNPGVALGVRAWVWGTYVLGPVLGAVIGVNLYAVLFAEPSALKATVGASASTAAKPARRAPAKKRATTRKKK